MPESRDLEKQLRTAVKTGKFVVGRREVLRSLKGTKMLVWSASANVPPQILDQSKSLGIPALKYNGNPIQLGRACGIPFKVSVIAIKAAGDSDLSTFQSSKDYTPVQAFAPLPSVIGSAEGIPAHSPEPTVVDEEKAQRAPPEEEAATPREEQEGAKAEEEKEETVEQAPKKKPRKAVAAKKPSEAKKAATTKAKRPSTKKKASSTTKKAGEKKKKTTKKSKK